MVWVDAAEFTDDLKVGCEVILESAEDAAVTVWRILSECRGRGNNSGRRRKVSRDTSEKKVDSGSESGKSEGEMFLNV
eukprot:symbB.v1.2.000233.t1/scaffold4.1/size633627/15